MPKVLHYSSPSNTKTSWRVRPLNGPTKYSHPDVRYFPFSNDQAKAMEFALLKATSMREIFIVEEWLGTWLTIYSLDPSKL